MEVKVSRTDAWGKAIGFSANSCCREMERLIEVYVEFDIRNDCATVILQKQYLPPDENITEEKMKITHCPFCGERIRIKRVAR